MKKLIIVLVVLLALVLATFFIPSNDSTEIDNNPFKGGDAVVFQLSGVNYKFIEKGDENPDIVVNKGDTVRIELTSAEGLHDWKVDEFDAAIRDLISGIIKIWQIVTL